MDKFEYYEKKIDLMEGQMDSAHIEKRSLQSEFDELERQESIDKELEALKSKMAATPAGEKADSADKQEQES